jgi:hypothetical protein
MKSKEKDAGKLMRILMLFMLFLSVHIVAAQNDIEVVGSGKTGTITYGETVTGTLEVTDASNIDPIHFVGHNGKNRGQGDFDVWNFDVATDGDNFIVRMTAVDGDFTPTLLVVGRDKTGEIKPLGVTNLDNNYDGDSEAGVCLWKLSHLTEFTIIAYRTEAVQGNYSLSLEKVDSSEALAGGSSTLWCSVGTFVYTGGDYGVNIRSDAGRQYSIKGKMQPGQPYNFSDIAGKDWTGITYQTPDGEGRGYGYVSMPLVRITGTLDADDTDETTPEPG